MSDQARFAEQYRDQYGPAIDDLLAALLTHDDKVALINPFIARARLGEIFGQAREEEIAGLKFRVVAKDLVPQAVGQLMSHYFLDRSSLFAPLLLPLSPGMKVLDMCSAPGGKLLVMLSRMIPDLSFVANDVSSARSERLRKVVNAFVPPGRVSIKITTKDASFFGLKSPGHFDAVLLDAPCSSEQHVIKNPHLLSQFKGLRKSLAKRQYSLLCSALLAVKPGGHIMYATCSINSHENEGVIKRLLKKKGDRCSVMQVPAPLGTTNEYGTLILPHLHQAGPAFWALIRRH